MECGRIGAVTMNIFRFSITYANELGGQDRIFGAINADTWDTARADIYNQFKAQGFNPLEINQLTHVEGEFKEPPKNKIVDVETLKLPDLPETIFGVPVVQKSFAEDELIGRITFTSMWDFYDGSVPPD